MLTESEIIDILEELIRIKKYMWNNSPWMTEEYRGTTEQREMLCKITGYSQAIIDLGYHISKTYNLPNVHEYTRDK